MARFPVVVGRTEKLSVVDTILNVPAKIDTGAYRSAIHCVNAKEVKRGETKVLRADLLGHPTSPQVHRLEFTNYEKVEVTNSFGQAEERYQIRLRIKLGPKVFNTSFTLADRSKNLFPILIGRKILKGRYFVDVARTGVDRLALKKEFGIEAPIDEEDLED